MRRLLLVPLWGLVILGSAGAAFAHCDGLDGPVVRDARRALAAGDLKLVLIWMRPADEPEVRNVFRKCLAVRKLGPEARDLADRHFFETVVRLHRAGEGAPYTGLKPAGRDLGPAIPTADRALEQGSAKELQRLLFAVTERGLEARFRDVVAKRNYPKSDVEAGRRYVAAYVAYIHYVERLYESASTPARGHYEEGGATPDPTVPHPREHR